ncbi:MAG: class B sortase [Roseburia hominis]
MLYSGDDETYLHTDLYGNASKSGCIFMEGNNVPDFNDCHTILYGHNMKNGSMFGSLKQYKNDGFYEKNAYFTVFTEDAAYRYQIFTYSDVPEDSDVYTTGYLPDETFDGFLTELLKSSYKDTGVAVGKDDKVLTLSTCSGDGLRFVVHAVRVDEHESGV